jgi:cell division protein FtsB
MEGIRIEVLASGILSVLVGAVAYFLKQLLEDFKKVEKDVSAVRSTTEVIRTEYKGMNDLLHQRMDFVDKRIEKIENEI